MSWDTVVFVFVYFIMALIAIVVLWAVIDTGRDKSHKRALEIIEAQRGRE